MLSSALVIPRLAERELSHNRQQMASGLEALEAKLAARPRVGPIPVAAHLYQGGTTPQCVPFAPHAQPLSASLLLPV
jgi:hypothetical protein